MKRLTLYLLTVSLTDTAFSQRFYIKPYAGYAIGINKGTLLMVSTDYTILASDSITYTDSYNLYRISMTKGRNYGGMLGINIFKNLRFELDANYIRIDSTVYPYTINWTFSNNSSPDVTGKGTVKFLGTMKSIAASICIPITFKNLTFYSKLGGIFVQVSMFRKETFLINNTLPGYLKTESYEAEFEYKKGKAIGFHTAAGTEFKLSGSNLSVFIETKFSFIRFTPTYSKCTKYTWQGQNMIGSLTTSQLETEFIDSYSQVENNNPDVPLKQIKQVYSFSNSAFTVGFKWEIPNDFIKKITSE